MTWNAWKEITDQKREQNEKTKLWMKNINNERN